VWGTQTDPALLWKTESQVLGETDTVAEAAGQQLTSDFQFNVNVPSNFADIVTFLSDITAPNIIYSLKAGSGISISTGQTPTISSTGVTSFQTKTGAITLEAGSGVSLDGLKITNSDTGSSQSIFKKIAVSGQTDVESDANSDTLTFVASGGVSITTDATNDKITINSASPDYTLSGWTDSGTSVYMTTTTDSVGIGTTSPTSKLHVVGSSNLAGAVVLGSATTDALTFTGRIANGTSLLPNTDLGSDLGSSSYRFNNLWVANVNSNSSSSFSGQTTFTYEPTATTYAESSVIINPTSPIADGFLFATGVAGYQRSGIDEDGDLSVGYLGNVSVPASDYPLSIYNHGTTRIAYFDVSGNLNIGGSIISGSGISSSGDFTMTAGTSIIPTVDQANAISIANSASVDYVSFDTSNSRVGIGTTTPDARFHLVGGDAYIAPDSGYTFDNASASEDLYVKGNLEVDGNLYPTALYLGGSLVSSTGTELNYLDGSTVTNGGVVFGNGTYMTQDATNFFWDNTNDRLGIGTTTPAAKIDLLATTEQLRLSYSASYYSSFTVGSTGILTLADTGTNVLSLGSAQVSFEVPTAFNAAGDVSVAYDLVLTNQNNAAIKSYGPLAFEAGESWESSNISLTTFNSGNVVIDSQALLTNYAATVSGQMVIGTATAPANIGNLYLTNSATFGKALAILNQTEAMDIFTASASGTTKFVIDSSGNVGVGTAAPGQKLQVVGSGLFGPTSGGAYNGNILFDVGNDQYPLIAFRSGTTTKAQVLIDASSGSMFYDLTGSMNFRTPIGGGTGTMLSIATSGNISLPMGALTVSGSGNSSFVGSVGIGTTAPTSKIHVSGAVIGKALAIFNETGDQDLFTASAGGTTKLTINHNGLLNATAGGLATFAKAGTISDADFSDTPVDGMMGIDTTNHRIYFREGGAWVYANKSAGFQIPNFEVAGMNTGDFLIPYVESYMSDGAVHGMYTKFADVKNQLLADIYEIIDGFRNRIASIERALIELGNRIVTKETHQEKLCVGAETDEVCLDKTQVEKMMTDLQSVIASVSAMATASATPTESLTPTPTPTIEPSITPEPTEAVTATGSGETVTEPAISTESGNL